MTKLFSATVGGLSVSIEMPVDAGTSMRVHMSCKGADDLVVDVPCVKSEGDGWIVGQGFGGGVERSHSEHVFMGSAWAEPPPLHVTGARSPVYIRPERRKP